MGQLSISQVAAGNFHYRNYPFTYFLDSIARMGVKNIEIWAAAPHLCVDLVTQHEVSSIKKEIQHRNLKTICFTPEQCVYPINLAAKEHKLRQYSVEYFKRSIEISIELDCQMVLVTPGSRIVAMSFCEPRSW